jgi:hypothetical protein
MLIPTYSEWDGVTGKATDMAQKAEHSYQDDYQVNVPASRDQSMWILGGLAALVALGLAIWFLSSSAPTTGTMNTAPAPAEQIAPAPAPETAPAPEAQPAPANPPAQAPAQ